MKEAHGYGADEVGACSWMIRCASSDGSFQNREVGHSEEWRRVVDVQCVV